MNKIITFIKTIIEIVKALIGLSIILATLVGVPITLIYFVITEVIFYKPKKILLKQSDMNPIHRPRSSKFQVESTGFHSIEGSVRLDYPSTLRVRDSSNYCYDIYTLLGYLDRYHNNLRLFGYLEQNNTKNKLKILYIRGTLQRNIKYNEHVRKTTDEQKQAMTIELHPKTKEWVCPRTSPEIDIIEIKYSYNNHIYHYKISDELEAEFKKDLIHTFK